MTDLDKYKYGVYNLGLDSGSEFSWADGCIEKNVISFGVDNSSSVHIDDKNEKYLSSW